MTYKMYSDGCHFAEFNAAGAGGYLLKDDETIFEFSEQIENKIYHTLHERYALKVLLEKSLEHKIENEKIEIFSDDKSLMKILAMPNRNTYNDDGNLLKEICDLCDKYTQLTFTYVPRMENQRADKLSRKMIEENLFTKHQVIDGGFHHSKWISKNNYPKGESYGFNMERQIVNNYLVIHLFYNKEDTCMQLEIYYAKKEGDTVSNEKIEVVKLESKGWQKNCINNITKHLNVMSDNVKTIGLVVHDEYIILDQLLRGRYKVPIKSQPAFDNLKICLEGLDKVFIHREPLVYEKIFNDNPEKMKSKKRII